MEANEDGRWHVPTASYAVRNPKRANDDDRVDLEKRVSSHS